MMVTRRLRGHARIALWCVAGLASAAQAQGISFRKDVVSLFQRHCVACHNTGEEQGNLGLAPELAYQSLVGRTAREANMPRVTPGAPERSYLFHKLRGSHLDRGGSGARMPMGLDPLDDADMDRVTAWIQSGAANN